MASDVYCVQKTFVTRMAFYLLCTVAVLQLTAARNCTDLIVYDGEKRLKSPRVDQSEDCSNGLRGFPDELAAGESVERARDFQAVPYSTRTAENHTVYGVRFAWKVPLSGSSRKLLKGFYLELGKVNTATRLCTTFDVRNSTMTISPSIHFSYSCTLEDSSEQSYRVLLLSLPPPSDAEYVEGLHVITSISVPASTDLSNIAAKDWTTWIVLKLHPKESKIEVKFGYPVNTSFASFDNYIVELVNKDNKNITRVEVQSTFPSETFGEYNFTNVQSGTYQVQIQPVSGKEPNCKCYHMAGPNLPDCDSCLISRTKQFNFTTFSATTRGPNNTTHIPERAAITTEPSAVNPAVVAPAAVVSLAIVALLCAVLCFWRHRRTVQRASQGRNDSREEGASESSQESHSPGVFLPVSLGIDGLQTPLIEKKSVLLLASEDHKYFSQALHSFAAFLRLHCQCHVSFAPQQLTDFVVFVSSAKAAFTLCQEYHKGRVCRSEDLGTEGDIYRRGIRHVNGQIVCDADVSKMIMVVFEHPSAEHQLPSSAIPPCFYRLPTRLKPFLLHLHGLDEATMDLSRVNLPLQGNLEELEGGGEWLEAVQKWKALEPNRPPSNHARDSGFSEGGLSSSHRRALSSVSAQTPEENPPYETRWVRGGSFSKSDFLPPSVIGSIVTVTPSAFTALSARPSQIDASMNSQQFRLINDGYEQDRRQEQEEQNQRLQKWEAVRPGQQLGESVVSDETDFEFSLQKTDCPQGDLFPAEPCDSDGHGDCLSILTGQSV